MTRPMRAVLYARCSSLKQADRDLSVPAQIDACRLYAQRQGWPVTAEHHDDGMSGFEDKRGPALSFDVIVGWDFSRFSRSLERSLKARKDLRAAGVSLESTIASIGRAEGVSGARVGQLLALLHLDPEIVAVLERPKEAQPRGLTHKAVREIARLRRHRAQRAAFGARWLGVLVEVAAKWPTGDRSRR